MVRSPGPAGAQGWWQSGRGRCGGKGQAPPCGAAHRRPSSRGGLPGGPGAPAPCCSSCMPRAGTGISTAALGDLAPHQEGCRGTHLLQKAGGGEGGDNGIGHGWADPVELPDLPPPDPPQPCAIFCHMLAGCPAPIHTEGKGTGFPVPPANREASRGFRSSEYPILPAPQSPQPSLLPKRPESSHPPPGVPVPSPNHSHRSGWGSRT